MTKEELKALGLNDEQLNKIMADYQNYIPKVQFEQKAEELKQLKTEQATITKELDSLKKANKDNTDLTSQIEQMKTDMTNRQKEYDSKIKQMQIDFAVDKSLISAKAKNPKAVKALLDLNNVELEGDKIKGLEEQLKNIKKSDSYLFEEDKKAVIKGLTPVNGSDEGGSLNPLSPQEQFEQALGL